jgi:hypothetical protein
MRENFSIRPAFDGASGDSVGVEVAGSDFCEGSVDGGFTAGPVALEALFRAAMAEDEDLTDAYSAYVKEWKFKHFYISPSLRGFRCTNQLNLATSYSDVIAGTRD